MRLYSKERGCSLKNKQTWLTATSVQVHSELLWHILIRHQGHGERLVDV